MIACSSFLLANSISVTESGAGSGPSYSFALGVPLRYETLVGMEFQVVLLLTGLHFVIRGNSDDAP
jgi:hypothetical protein